MQCLEPVRLPVYIYVNTLQTNKMLWISSAVMCKLLPLIQQIASIPLLWMRAMGKAFLSRILEHILSSEQLYDSLFHPLYIFTSASHFCWDFWSTHSAWNSKTTVYSVYLYTEKPAVDLLWTNPRVNWEHPGHSFVYKISLTFWGLKWCWRWRRSEIAMWRTLLS